MGTRFEQRVLAELQQLIDLQPHIDADSVFERLLARAHRRGPILHDSGRDGGDPEFGGLTWLRTAKARQRAS